MAPGVLSGDFALVSYHGSPIGPCSGAWRFGYGVAMYPGGAVSWYELGPRVRCFWGKGRQ